MNSENYSFPLQSLLNTCNDNKKKGSDKINERVGEQQGGFRKRRGRPKMYFETTTCKKIPTPKKSTYFLLSSSISDINLSIKIPNVTKIYKYNTSNVTIKLKGKVSSSF